MSTSWNTFKAKDVSKWTAALKKFEADTTRYEFVSASGLHPQERRLIHELAQQMNYHSESRGEGNNRVVIVMKKDVSIDGGKCSYINTTTQKRFREDFDVKINLCDPNDFDYFVDLYKAKDKLQHLTEAQNEIGVEEFPAHVRKLKEHIVEKISSTNAFKKFQTMDLKPFSVAFDEHCLSGNPYHERNNHKYFVSIDFKSANFNSLRFVDPDILLGFRTWSDLITHETKFKYFQESKLFRQKIFHLLEPTKTAIVTLYLIHTVYRKFCESGRGVLSANSVVYINQDEMIVEVERGELEQMIHKLRKIINSEMNDLADIVCIEGFRITQISSHYSYFAKEVIANVDKWSESDANVSNQTKVIFKNVPTEHYAICFKHYYGIEINDKDTKVAWCQKTRSFTHVDVDKLKLLPREELITPF